MVVKALFQTNVNRRATCRPSNDYIAYVEIYSECLWAKV